MKRPVAHAVKNRKTFGVEQGFFMKLIQGKRVFFMLKFHKDANVALIFAPNPHFYRRKLRKCMKIGLNLIFNL